MPTKISATATAAAVAYPIGSVERHAPIAAPSPIAPTIRGRIRILSAIAIAITMNAIDAITVEPVREKYVTLGESASIAEKASAPASPRYGRIANALATR